MSEITRRLRDENEALRKRVTELETAYDALLVVRIDELAAAIIAVRERKPPMEISS